MNNLIKNNKTKTLLVLLIALFLLMNDLTIVYGISQELIVNSEELNEIDIENSKDDDKIVENIDLNETIESESNKKDNDRDIIDDNKKEEVIEPEEDPKKSESGEGNKNESENFIYEDIDEDNIRLLKYTGSLDEDIVIPKEIDGKKVKEIGDGKNNILLYKNGLTVDIRVEADNIILNDNSFNNIKLYNNSLEFKGNIKKIKEHVFKNLRTIELTFPQDMSNTIIEKNAFESTSIDYFDIPLNLEISDGYVDNKWISFKITSINEPVDDSIKYLLGVNNHNVAHRFIIGKDYTNIENLNLGNVFVDDIFIPSHVESISDDAFKDMRIKNSIVFYDRDNFDNINLENILSNINQNSNKEIKVYIPKEALENIPDVEGFEFLDYNDIILSLEGNELYQNKITPTINDDYDDYNELIFLVLEFNNVESVLDRIIHHSKNDFYRSKIYPEEPAKISNLEIEIPKYITGNDPENKIPFSVNKVLRTIYQDNSNEVLEYSIEDRENSNVIKIDELLSNREAYIFLKVGYLKNIDKDDLYSFEIKFNSDYKVKPINIDSTLSESISKTNLEFIEADLRYNSINYHILDVDTLMSLDEKYNDINNISLEYLLNYIPNIDDFSDIRVFSKENFLDDKIGNNAYNSYKFDIKDAIYNDDTRESSPDILSHGISAMYGSDNQDIDIEDLPYEVIDPDELKFEPTRNGKDLKYIVFGDNNIIKNTKKYFNGDKDINDIYFKVLDFNGKNFRIEDYVDEFDIFKGHMLLIYGELEPEVTPPEEKPKPEKPGGGGGSNRPSKPPVEKPKPEPEEPKDPEIEVEPSLNIKDHIKYIQGYKDKTIKPEDNITREEVSAIFFRLLDPEYREYIRKYDNNYYDINTSRWSNKHISTLSEGEILKGYPDGNFKPSKSITRAEVAVIASRFDDLEILDESKFSDVKGHWAEKYIDSAEKKGWITGYEDGSFKPNKPITRGEFVTLVNNVLNRKVNRENILDNIKEFKDLNSNAWYYEAMVEASNSHDYEEDRLENNSEIWTELTNPDIEM